MDHLKGFMRFIWLGWHLPVITLILAAVPASAAIRLSQPQSASGEIDLGRIPDSHTSVYLRIRPSVWTQFINHPQSGRSTRSQPSSQILKRISSSMDSSMASILGLCFVPVVNEFLVAKWPSRHSWDIEQPVWMIGLALADHGAVDFLANDMIASSSSPQGLLSTRKLRGFPLTSLSLPGRQLHFLKGERHLLISPNLFLIQGYLESLDSPPEPPSMTQPDALIGWRLTAAAPENKQTLEEAPNPIYAQMGIDRIEFSVQNLPIGLEVRIKAKTLVPSTGKPFLRPLNLDLLDSIPSDSDLVIAGGGLDLLQATPGGEDTVDRPFAVGVSVPEGRNTSPRLWKVGGAVERRVAVANAPDPVSAELSERLGGLLDDLGQLGKDLNSLVVEDRIVFGEPAGGAPPPEESQQLKDHFAELARDAILAGVISPELLILPLRWDALLGGGDEKESQPWLQIDWRKEMAPIEFSLNRPGDGYEIRFISSSPASYVMLLADLLFLLHIDYAGEWENLTSEWEKSIPSSPARPVQ
jgi:hypothetical protein